ncbi:MAG: c-type cytochrome [Acidiferrobacterales bacterium]
MYKSSLLTLLACSALYITSGAALAAGDPVAGKDKAYHCAGCHAVPGYRYMYPAIRVPKLGGQHAAYIVNALKEYQAGARLNPTMHANAATLSDQDMQDIAAFFASQKDQPSK